MNSEANNAFIILENQLNTVGLFYRIPKQMEIMWHPGPDASPACAGFELPGLSVRLHLQFTYVTIIK